MTIPYEVRYIKTGNKKTRMVIGVLCQTALYQKMFPGKVKDIFLEMGDLDVNWNESSKGFELMMDRNKYKII